MKAERVICPRCGRDVAARCPVGGDGSALRLVQHNANGLGQCSGSHRVYDWSELGEVSA